MPAPILDYEWEVFEQERLPGLFGLTPERRSQFIFRGTSDARFALQPTVDRRRKFASVEARDRYLMRLGQRFRLEATGLEYPLGVPREETQWELLARHHGLDSAILDWTSSVYVAAFFAFVRPSPDATHVAIWCFDRNALLSESVFGIEIYEDYTGFEFNLRAIEQASVFMAVRRPEAVENIVNSRLWCFRFPISDRQKVIPRLTAMRITDRHLFRDLDAAARSAMYAFEGAET